MESQQDKIKPQHSPNNLLHKILKELSPMYLGPKAFLSLQQKTLEISYQTSKKEFQPKSFCNKYFGKKILYVINPRGLKQAVDSCKLFQRARFDKNMCSKEDFKAKGDLILIGKDTKIQMEQIAKAVRGIKGKVSIILNQNNDKYSRGEMYQRRSHENSIVFNYSFWLKKWLRNCHVELQSLSLTLQSMDQLPTWKISLINLRHFSLKFDKKFARKCGWKPSGFLGLEYTFESFKEESTLFLLRIIEETKHLQTMRLDIAPYSITPTPLAYLLLALNYYKIPEWYVRIGTVSEDFMKILNGINIKEIDKMTPAGLKSTCEVFEKVDLLAIYVVNYVEEIMDEYEPNKYEDYGAFRMSVARLGEMPEVTCKYKRILDVSLMDFSLDKPTINLKRVLGKFPALEGLYLKIVENVVIFEENDDDTFKWTRNLREVFLTFLALTGTNEFDFKSETGSFSRLMEVLKTRCLGLNSLNVFRGHPVYDCDGNITVCKKIELNVPCEEIQGMNCLRELEIYSDNKGLKSIGEALSTLKNLEKLKINIVNTDSDFEFLDERQFCEFDEKEKILSYLPEVKELELTINPSEQSIKWADHFAKYIGSLESLEVLKVNDLNKDEIRFEVLMKIVDGLSRKRTLRSVEIDCVIVQDDSTLEFAAGLWKSKSKGEIEELGIKSLQEKVVQIMELNLELEFAEIKDFKDMKIGRIFSDVRTKI